MDLNFTPEEEVFRAEVREFVAQAMPPDIRETVEAGELRLLAAGRDLE